MTETDLLYGAKAIAAFLGMRTTQVYPMIHKGTLPIIKIGAKVAARKSTLESWLSSKEAPRSADVHPQMIIDGARA